MPCKLDGEARKLQYMNTLEQYRICSNSITEGNNLNYAHANNENPIFEIMHKTTK
jgi:hypothetical protein